MFIQQITDSFVFEVAEVNSTINNQDGLLLGFYCGYDGAVGSPPRIHARAPGHPTQISPSPPAPPSPRIMFGPALFVLHQQSLEAAAALPTQ